MISKIKIFILALVAIFTLSQCGVYSFSGIDIPADINTVSVAQFPNNAQLVMPTLSQFFSEKFREKLISQTRLKLEKYNADIAFEGAIIQYSIDPVSFTGNETTAYNRLTIGVRLSYINNKNNEKSYETTFSRFSDFDASKPFSTVEQALIEEITLQLIDDIFNKTFVNW